MLKDLTELQVGLEINRDFVFSEQRVESFAALVGDTAPAHTDEDFARELGYEGRITHGLFAAAILSGILGMELPGARSVINSLSLKMHHPVYIGQTVSYSLVIRSVTAAVRAVGLEFKGTVDGKLVASGKAICSFPS